MAANDNADPIDVLDEDLEEDEEPVIDFTDPPYPDDLQLRAVPPHPDLLRAAHKDWRWIRTGTTRLSANAKQYNLRYDEPFLVRLKQYVQHIFDEARRPFAIMAMAGYYLQISETEAGLFYAEENTQIHENPARIRKQADLDRYVAEWPSNAQIVRDWKRYFDTKVKVLGIANVLFYVVTLGGRTLQP